MEKEKHVDYYLLFTALALVLLGIFALSNASYDLSQERFGRTSYYLMHQIIYGLIPGVILGILAYKTPTNFIKKYALIMIIANLVLMAAVFAPGIGMNLKGASRWIHLGPASFQPSEFLKLTFIIYLAALLSSWKDGNRHIELKKNSDATLLPFLAVLGVVALLLYLQSDISTLGIIIFVAIIMYFLARAPIWHLIVGIAVVVAGMFAFVKIENYRAQRIFAFLNPEIDPMGIGYQIKQALIAIGSGGIMGVGPGRSRQKFGFLPESMSDSIFAIYAEETGFIGALILMGLFIFFLWRAFKISKLSSNKFFQLASAGIISWIIIQTFINIGAMTGIMPLAGIPLPFFSAGGSALIAEITAIGILLNISKKYS